MGNDFNKRLLATFAVETRERIAAIAAGLIELEKTAAEEKRQEILEAVTREAHSLKGAARAVNVAGIEALCHALESVFSALKRGLGTASPGLFDLLHQAVDTIGRHPLSPGPEQGTAGESRIRELVKGLEKCMKGKPVPVPPVPQQEQRGEPAAPGRSAVADTLRIPAGKLDRMFHQAEEMLAAKLAARQRAVELAGLCTDLALWEKEWEKTRPVMRGLHKALQPPDAGRGSSLPDAARMGRLLAFLEWSHDCIKSVQNKACGLAGAAESDQYALAGMVDNLLEEMKEALMLPCATILEVLPKMVRDLARDRGKDAELVLSGEGIEIDKRVLEEIKDPLIHLVRNCIDHGIERPAERNRLNKTERGEIAVKVSLIDSGRIEILVADDGAGIDSARLTSAAVQRGVVTQEEAARMGQEDLLGLAFSSGLSTSPMLTDISGRGLGLAIVREKVQKLGGTITVASETHRGTTFRMVLPLTLSTFRGIIVRAAGQTFIVPAAAVERVARVDKAALKTVENRETVDVEGVVSFVRLADILQLSQRERAGADSDHLQLFVLGSGAGRIAFGVDGILDEQEVLVKGLGRQLSRVRNIAGAAVLAQGKVVTILHPGDLVKSAVKGAAAATGAVHPAETAEEEWRTVLVVEDSITARSLLKNILETAGYRVETAVDGVDALTQLRTAEIDLVVSDVDMPRMNGFDLTARIRASREFAELPVVLVTSLDSREDKERGIDVGANAYVVKSSFDQSNLLEVVKRLI